MLVVAEPKQKQEKSDSMWDAVMSKIDPFANEDDSTIDNKKPEKVTSNNHHKKTTKPLPEDATLQQMSEHARSQHLRAKRSHTNMVERLLNDAVPKYSSSEETPIVKDSDVTIQNTIPNLTSSYSAEKTVFNWGGKEAGFEYIDFEFKFESTNTSHTKKLAYSMQKMSDSNWMVDLHRSFQEVEGSGVNITAYTTTQMRFRRRH